MTQKSIKMFLIEIYSKRSKMIYATNKTDVYQIADLWSLDKLDLKEYSPENNRGYRNVFVILDNFSEFAWTVPLENKHAQTKKYSFEKVLINSKRKSNLIETDRGKEF